MRKLARMAPLAMATSCALAYAGPSRAGGAMVGEMAQGRAESWWVKQIKEFRTYPHLDRSYRLIKDGLYAAASSEQPPS